MQLMRQKRLTAAVVTLLLTSPALATNGYFTHGIGAKNKAMAGSGLAMPEDAISVANNPAAALASTGNFDLGISIFSPSRHYETSESVTQGNGGAFTIGPNDIDSSRSVFFIPNMAVAWEIDEKSAWAAAFYGRGGMNTTWKGGSATFNPGFPQPVTAPGTYGAGLFGNNGTAGVDLSQAFLDLAYARRVGDSFTVGVSLVGVMQVFAARGVGTFGQYTETFVTGGNPVSLSNNGHDQSYGVGGKLGVHWDIAEQASLAASYTPKIKMSKLKDYSDLFADGGNMDIPADLKVGLTFKPNPGLALNFDIERIWYNDVVSVGNPFANLFTCSPANPGNCLGGKTGAGFGWQNMTVYKVGAQWNDGGAWTWRAGYSHGDQPIPESEVVFNILAPGVIEDHLTAGFTHKLASGNEYSLALMYALNKKVSGPNPLDHPNPDFAQTVFFDMDQWELEFSFGWR